MSTHVRQQAGGGATLSPEIKKRPGWLQYAVHLPYLFILATLYLDHFQPKAHTLIFFCSCLGIIPAAAWVGRATEQLAERVGQGVGGLLNATFGNAAELIITIVALKAGDVE